MPALYLANPTNQTQIVSYRMEFNKEGEQHRDARFRPANSQEIKAGQQIMLGARDMHQKQINSIMDQLRPYGLHEVSKLGEVKPGEKITYLASPGLVVPTRMILQASLHNRQLKTEEGRVRRANAAIATDQTVQNAVSQKFLEQGIDAMPADKTSVAFEQLDQNDEANAKEPMLAEGYDVAPEGKPGLTSQRPPKKANQPRPPRKK